MNYFISRLSGPGSICGLCSGYDNNLGTSEREITLALMKEGAKEDEIVTFVSRNRVLL